jgi:hypothetical protein
MHTSIETNPFALMMDPQTVLAAMERLDRSTQAQRRICRPLDKPVPVKPTDESSPFDRNIDSLAD